MAESTASTVLDARVVAVLPPILPRKRTRAVALVGLSIGPVTIYGHLMLPGVTPASKHQDFWLLFPGTSEQAMVTWEPASYMAACQLAVAAVRSHQEPLGIQPPSGSHG
jgi:hypothetical protein